MTRPILSIKQIDKMIDEVEAEETAHVDEATKPDWETKCGNCDQVPTVPATGLCGPCTWGEADTAGGNW